MRILVIDVGGSNVKVLATGRTEPVKIPSGPDMSAAEMAAAVKKAIVGWKYDAVSIGFPGPVVNNRPAAEPANLGGGWVRFDYKKALGKPVRILNDAAIQALGSYQGGRMLFLGLGTGLGSALVADGVLEPLELAHLPYRNRRSYEDYVGLRGYKRLGRKRWTKHVARVVELLKHGLQADYVVLGGGQTRKLRKVPKGVRLGRNANAFLGGYRMWEDQRQPHWRKRPRVARSRPAKKPKPVPADAAPPS
jgi:predicted NBD/HSP70 family sugar kinase